MHTSVNIKGLITHQTNEYKIKLSVFDGETAQKIRNIMKHKIGHRIPLHDDTYQIMLSNTTKITSKAGREDIECLPRVIGWRCVGKVNISSYKFKSKFGENRGEVVEGVVLRCTSIHLGS